MRVTWSIVVVLAACGPRGTAPLSKPGANEDDGVGVLARSSVRVLYDGAGDDDGAGAAPDDTSYQRAYDYDPLAYYGYGSFGYGGFGYGGFGYGGGGLGFGYGTASAREAGPYDGRSGSDFGSIEGAIAWKADGGVAWPADCPLARVARAGAPVAGAVVYLDKVGTGRPVGGRTGGVLTATACGLTPAVQVVGPLPASVIVESAAATATKLAVTSTGREVVDLDPGGRLELPVMRGGMLAIDGGGAPAWVIGEANPYYEVTDELGRFALDLVPAGTYTLVVWSPPLVTSVTGGAPVWSAATIERRTVVVPASGPATVQLALTPAR